VAVQFLSDEFMTDATSRLNASDPFKSAIAGLTLDVQFVVTDVPNGDTINYVLAISDGSATVSLTTIEDFDASVTNTYETGTAISRGELNTQMAFMTGKIKIGGNPSKLIMHQNVFVEFANALKAMDVTYSE
jgi:putative sterol carrier protein